MIGRGFAEVGADHAVILTDTAEEVGTLNAGDIQAALQRDEERLRTLSSAEGDYAVLLDRIERNRARLNALGRH